MKLTAICIGTAEKLDGRGAKTGIAKTPANAALFLDAHGLVGDRVCNTKHHGGPDQAVLVEGTLTLDWWAQRLGRPVPPGTFGENLVIDGLDNRDIAVGDRFLVGDAVLEATAARIPCATLSKRMGDPKFAGLYNAAARPGIYCRVIRPGLVQAGEAVALQRHAGERVMIAEMLGVTGRNLPDEKRRRLLAAPISLRFREMLSA